MSLFSGGSQSSPSASQTSSGVSLSGGKPEDMLWFHRALTMTQILRHVTYGHPQGQGVTMDAISDASQLLTLPTAHTRLLVLTGIPVHSDALVIRQAIKKAVNSFGGLFKDELFLPLQDIDGPPPGQQVYGEGDVEIEAAETSSGHVSEDREEVMPTAPLAEEEDGMEEPEEAPRMQQVEEEEVSAEAVQHQIEAAQTVTTEVSKSSSSFVNVMPICGYAVIELRTKTKMEAVRKALYQSMPLISSANRGDLPDLSEDILSISAVNQNLQSESPGNIALGHYLYSKILVPGVAGELSDNAMIALTEIFHSCFISEQRLSLSSECHQESGYICLSREQIMLQTPGNLLHLFFSNVRAAKRTFPEQVGYVLKRYGITKMADKDE